MNANAKFLEVAKLLGFETEVRPSGMIRVTLNACLIGTMTAEAWLEHLRHAMIKTGWC